MRLSFLFHTLLIAFSVIFLLEDWAEAQIQPVQARTRILRRELKPPSKTAKPTQQPTPQPAATPGPEAEMTPQPAPTPQPALGLQNKFEGSLESSLLLTKGNTDTQNFGFATTMHYRPSPWEYQVKSSYINNSDGTGTTAENFSFDIRGGKNISARMDLFTEFLYQSDRFAGIDHRTTPEFGQGYEWILADPVQLRTEVALGYTFEDRTDGTKTKFVSGRLGFLFAWRFSETAGFSHETSVFPNLERTGEFRIRSETEVFTEMTRGLALKFAYRYDYNSANVAGTSPEDRRTMASIVLRF